MKRFLVLSVFILSAIAAQAQKVVFEVSAPSIVMAGEAFRVEFSVNAKPDNFSAPAISGFEILAGPSMSQGQSIQIVNGNVTKNVNFTYTYILQAPAEGRYTIPPAEVKVDGKSYSTSPHPVEAISDSSQQGASGTQGRNGSGNQQQATGATVSANDIFVRVSVDKTSVYKGQPLKAIFKLYSRLDLSGVESQKFPAFNGFWTQELNQGNQKWQQENVNGNVYSSVVLREYLLYPQQAGTLQIEQFDMTVIAQIVTQARRQSMFDDFFSGGPNIQEVRKKLSSAPIRINVKELPSGAPESFNGAVGKFSIESLLSQDKVAANSAFTYSIKISGTGNLPLIRAPKVNLPTSFEQYNIKSNESLSTGSGGISGYRQFEYPVIARAEGEYTVEPVEFTYFNPEQMRYVTLSTAPSQIVVSPDASSAADGVSQGLVSGLSKEDLKIIGKDIRFIKIGSPGLSPKGNILLGSVVYYMILLVLLIIAVVLYFYLEKRMRLMRNTAFVKGKRANKVALQRFRAAERFMKEGNRSRFFEEMLRALWGYMSDKLNIPVANLTKENVRDELHKRNLPPELSERFVQTISQCEYAQYSPAVSGEMNEVYVSGVELISKFESLIK